MARFDHGWHNAIACNETCGLIGNRTRLTRAGIAEHY